MDEENKLSKYARKQQRLMQESNFGIDYSKQIEVSQLATDRKDEDKANKENAVLKYRTKIENARKNIDRLQIIVNAVDDIIKATPAEHTNVRIRLAKKKLDAQNHIVALNDAIQRNQTKIDKVLNDLKENNK